MQTYERYVKKSLLWYDIYDNTITHRTIKMKPIDAKPDFCAEWNVKSIEKDPLKLVIM